MRANLLSDDETLTRRFPPVELKSAFLRAPRNEASRLPLPETGIESVLFNKRIRSAFLHDPAMIENNSYHLG